MILDEESFIDLYEMLDVSPETDASALRKRISVMYLEAGENLDHQNHRKRFYYRELYEIHLPNARLILLDLQKRAAYNEKLQAYSARKGKKPSARKPQLAISQSSPKKSIDPFAEFGDVEDDIPLPPVTQSLRMERKDVEQRRDVKRRELIKNEIIANGFKWGFGGGLGVLSGCVLLVLALNALLPGGVITASKVSPFIFLSICAVLMMAASVFTARQTMRWARKRTVGYLSKLPYDELLRQCAG